MSRCSKAPSSWLALSETGVLDQSSSGDLMHKGQFVLELALPLTKAAVLLDHQSNSGWPRSFTLLFDPQLGFLIAHRQGARLVRHLLAGPIRQGQGLGRLTFDFDAPARRWQLRFEDLAAAEPVVISSQGTDPLPLPIADIAALCAPNFACNPQVLWFGARPDTDAALAAPWVGLRTEVETSLGAIAAANLRPGDMVMTLDQGPQMLLACQPVSLPARGSFAPVLLRAPYFGQQQDMLVCATQMIAMTGPEITYLFDQDSVLVPASGLVDGRTALFDDRRAMIRGISLRLATPALILADGCALCLGSDTAADLPLQPLRPFETVTLMSRLRRNKRALA
jgi:hypothetical protein